MKRGFYVFILLTCMASSILVSGAQANKSTPYPGPDQIQGDPYIPPETTPLPAPQLDFPVAQTDVPFAWGTFPELGPIWWVSWHTGFNDPFMTGHLCVIRSNGGLPYCYDLSYAFYDAASGTIWLKTDPRAAKCSQPGYYWLINYVEVERVVGTFRQPNEYQMNCVYLPRI